MKFIIIIDAFARRHSLAFVDGLGMLHRGAEALYFPGDAHLNADGHARIARTLDEALRCEELNYGLQEGPISIKKIYCTYPGSEFVLTF